MDVRPGETVLYDGHPSWRSILGFYLMGVVAAAVVGVVAILVSSTATGVGVIVGVLVVVVVVGLLKRVGTTYIITSQRLYIRRGILSKSEQQTRLERIQNVNTKQSLLERVLQTGTVDFDTAADDDGDFSFAGVAHPARVVKAVDDAQHVGDAAPPPTTR